MTKLSLHEQANAASYASGYLATATAEMKNSALIAIAEAVEANSCLLYTSPSPRD